MKTKIYLAGDHAGFKLKEKIKEFLDKKKIPYLDYGPECYDKNDDYPDFVIPCAEAVKKDKNSIGIFLAGSGQGEAIAANKIKGIRVAVYYGGNLKLVKLAKEHNNANILSIGSRFATEQEAKKAITLFLKTKFAKGRHERRVKKIETL